MKVAQFIKRIKDAGSAGPEGSAQEVERKYGVSFPEDYRSFVKECRGGSGGGMVIETAQVEFCPFRVGGFVDDPDISLMQNNSDFSRDGLFWIMGDEGGNSLGMSLREKDHGTIYFVDHETAALGEKPARIAKNFTALVKKCRIDEVLMTDELRQKAEDPDVQFLLSIHAEKDRNNPKLVQAAVDSITELRDVLGVEGARAMLKAQYGL